MVVYVSADLGSSFTKIGMIGQEAIFPSLAVPSRPGQGICCDGAWRVIGQDALRAQRDPSTNPQPGAEYHGSSLQRAIMCEAARRMGLGGQAQAARLELIVGLPFVLARDETAAAAVCDSLKRLQWTDAQGDHEVVFEAVHTPPQGGGALYEWMRDNTFMAGDLVAVVDIGGQTADIVVIECGDAMGDEEPVHAASDSIRCNVEEFYHELVARLRQRAYATERHYDYHSDMARIARGLRDATPIRMPAGAGRKPVDITRHVEATRIEWTHDLARRTRDIVGARWHDLSAVVLTGGGAQLVVPELWPSEVVISDSMANVRGQLRAFTKE